MPLVVSFLIGWLVEKKVVEKYIKRKIESEGASVHANNYRG